MLFNKKVFFEFTAYLEILVMYCEGRRISCISGVSRPNGETWQLFVLKLLG